MHFGYDPPGRPCHGPSELAVSNQGSFASGPVDKAIDEYMRYSVPAVLVDQLSQRYAELIYNQEHKEVIKQEAVRHRTLTIETGNILAQASPLTFTMIWTKLYTSVRAELEIAVLEKVIAQKRYASQQASVDYLTAIAAWDAVMYTSPMSFESKQGWVNYSITAKAEVHLRLQKEILEDKQRLQSLYDAASEPKTSDSTPQPSHPQHGLPPTPMSYC